MHGPTPSFFVCTRIFVLWFGQLVLYKYWPTPTCIFFSLVIISLLLVISACFLLSRKLYSFDTHTEHRILIFSHTSLDYSYSFAEDFSESILHPYPRPLARNTAVQLPTPTNRPYPGHHYICPDTSLRLSRHSIYLTTALVKYSETLPMNGHFRLSLTSTIGFRSHQYAFGTLRPSPSGTP